MKGTINDTIQNAGQSGTGMLVVDRSIVPLPVPLIEKRGKMSIASSAGAPGLLCRTHIVLIPY